ncbi:hypothetical protein N665_1060s0005 [Sinapis alba]|nr:hypothetical protein N665_1060s0005 [Sinapis alba]
MSSEIGRVHSQIQEAAQHEEDTPLKKKLNEFGEALTMIIGLILENGTHEEDEEKEEDEVAEEDEEDKSKLGEEVVVEEDEEENKHEEYEIDEQDQSKTDEDTDKDDELLEEEKEKETNHADETDMTVDEAREEHYKADDASRTAQENNSNATLSEVEVQKEPVLEKTTTEVKDGDSESSTSEAKSVVNESRGETTVNGNSTEGGSSDEQTVVKLEQTRNESAPNITISANVTSMDSIQDESRNSTSESSVTENISGSNRTEVKKNTRSEGDVETGEKESSNYFPTEQTEEADDTPESTMLQEEREALTDPQTLPDIRIEGNEDDEEEAISAE